MKHIDIQLFINGEWVPSQSGETSEAVNPVNAKPMGKVAKGGREDVQLALEVAHNAFKSWSRTTGENGPGC